MAETEKENKIRRIEKDDCGKDSLNYGIKEHGNKNTETELKMQIIKNIFI